MIVVGVDASEGAKQVAHHAACPIVIVDAPTNVDSR